MSPAFSTGTALADDLVLPEGPDALGEFAFVEDDVIVPIPSEIFNALGRFHYSRQDWRTEIISPSRTPCKTRTQTALYLGSIVADGFLAVQAEDANAIRDCGRVVLDLAQALGMRDAVLRHTKTIESASENGNWAAVRKEFDATRETVSEIMEQRRDEDLAHCVSIGGWLRGTEIVTSIVQANYHPEKGEILYQPAILDHFSKVIRNMAPAVKGTSQMKTISRQFRRLESLMGRSNHLSAVDVASIHGICKALREKTIRP